MEDSETMDDVLSAIFRQIKHLGEVLLDDDWYDFGWYQYFDRYGHPDHPSPFHHWQLGAALIAMADMFSFGKPILESLGISITKFLNDIGNLLKKIWG